MQFKTLHSWDLSAQAAVALQKKLAGQVSPCDDFPTPVKRVAGADVSYRRSSRQFHAAVVVLDYDSMVVLETATASGNVAFPYIPGLLSFRELPILLQAFQKLETLPDAILADGQGIAHPRRLGLASHLGLWLDLPTIGCAKSRLCGEHEEPGLKRGDWTPLWADGVILGRVVRTKDNVRPLYLSPGHKIDHQSVTDMVVHSCQGYRLPEPTRQAHLLSNRIRLESETRTEK
ncbi:MAG: deoxyribonuclease V [Desulfuromonadales bacterium]